MQMLVDGLLTSIIMMVQRYVRWTTSSAQPRKNLCAGRRFERVRVDLESEQIFVFYRNEKSCCITLSELNSQQLQANDDVAFSRD